MKKTTAILACLLLLANAAMSNAAIIVTTSFLETSALNAPTVTYRVRSVFSTNANPGGNFAASYGFQVAITGGTISNLAASNPPNIGNGFTGPFTNGFSIVNPTTVQFTGLGGTNQNFALATNGIDDVRDLTFSFTRGAATVLSATPTAASYAGTSATALGSAAGGTGFVTSPGDASFNGTTVSGLVFNASTASITAVPEPSSVGLLAVAGIFGFGIRMRGWRFKGKSAA